tara:strand:+ start:266 stop:1189 length:924 start_codon:yes stop_codon:yes gene_type:complete
MNKFFKNGLSFFSILILIILLSDIMLSWFQNKFASFELIERPKYIMLGTSHSACAFNDTLISDFINLSDLGESYFYTFIKLKKILEQNKSIETVFLEYSNNQTEKIMDEWIWGYEKMNYRYNKYSSYMNLNEHLLLIKNNPINFISAYSRSLRYKLEFFLFNKKYNISSIGSFTAINKKMKEKDFIKIKGEVREPLPKNISKKNIEFLIKIINYCKENDVRIILIRSPILTYSNEKFYYQLLQNELSNIDYFDFANFPLKNIHYANQQHLNVEGARLLSEWFELLLKKNFINDEEQKILLKKEIKSW